MVVERTGRRAGLPTDLRISSPPLAPERVDAIGVEGDLIDDVGDGRG